MNNKLDYLIALIKKLNKDDRAKLDDVLLHQIVKDAENQRQEYQLELASDYITDARELIRHWGEMQGISSGYPTIDRMTKGFVAGEVTVIGGATSNGKTTLAVNIASRIITQDIPVLFVTLEMTKAQLTSRLMFANPSFEEHAANLSFQKADELNWASIDGLIERAVREVGAKVVIIDHLHYFTRELNNVAEDLGRITKEFKKNASRHNIPILLISHTRKGDGNSIDDLRGSSYIAQDADIVLMVSREKDIPTQIAVSIQKNRNRGFDPNSNEHYLNFDKTRILEDSELKAAWNTYQ